MLLSAEIITIVIEEEKMASNKQGEEAIVASHNETTDQELIGKDQEGLTGEEDVHSFNMKSLLWHGGSVYDAWFSCASNQVTIIHSFGGCVLDFEFCTYS